MPKSWEQGSAASYNNLFPKLCEVLPKLQNVRECEENQPLWKQCDKTICNKNVIIFEKGVAFCKLVCYNTVTYI